VITIVLKFKKKIGVQVWWHRPIIPALGRKRRRRRKKNDKLKASLGYIVRPCLKKIFFLSIVNYLCKWLLSDKGQCPREHSWFCTHHSRSTDCS
jgi:hypothetical protein